MQSILSIDTSVSPPLAAIVQVDGTTASVQEIHQLQNPTEQSENQSLSQQVCDLIAGIKTPWTSSVLLLPPSDYLSLNVSLPFANAKSLDKIIDLEVQDNVPFDTKDFLLHHRPLISFPSSERDVHVGLTRKSNLIEILASCRKKGLEPQVVSNPATALGTIPFLHANGCDLNSIFILARPEYFALALSIEGQIVCDRFISRRGEIHDAQTDLSALQEIRLSLLSWEQRYDKKISMAYYLSETPASDNFSTVLGINVNSISPRNLVGASDESTVIAALASVFAIDVDPPTPLTNFRTRELAYSPRLDELVRGLRALLPWILTTISVLLIVLLATFGMRERRISQINDNIRAQIMKAVPEVSVPAGQEIDALEGVNRRLDQQLSSLGSLSALSPLDYLAEISNDLPLTSGISVSRVKIDANKMRVDGTAPDYAAMEKIEKYLKRKKSIYCKVRKDTTASSPLKPNARGYSLDIVLCE